MWKRTCDDRLTRELLDDDEDIIWLGLLLTTTVPGDPAMDETTTAGPPGTGTTLLLILFSMADVLLAAAFLCWKFSIMAATSPARPPLTAAPSGVVDSSLLKPLTT